MLKNLNAKILSGIFLLLCIIIIAATFTVVPFNKIAEALSNSYSKPTTGGQLTVTDWNNLDDDFLARTGGASSAMQGDLDMGSHRITNLTTTADTDAVTRGAMNTAIATAVAGASNINSTSGNNLKLICATTPLTLVNTSQYGTIDKSHIRVVINTSAAGFTSSPIYFASLQGLYSFLSYGAEDVYPTGNNQLAIQLSFIGENRDGQLAGTGAPGTYLTPAQAVNWGWSINWCGLSVN